MTPLRALIVIAVAALAAHGASSEPLAEVAGVASDSVQLSLRPRAGAGDLHVYLAAEPGDASDRPLPGQVLLATLPASTASYRIERLAAAVDVFVRVEQSAASATLHARTAGGPRAALSSRLREVHMAAPSILMLVFEDKRVRSFNSTQKVPEGTVKQLVGYNGPALQAGPWTVSRAGGEPIGVAKVYRHSVPVFMPEQEHNDILDVDHRIYLVFQEPVGQREVLSVKGPLDTDFLLPFSDRYLETPSVQVNQVGYAPKAKRRYAYVSGWLGDGGALPLTDYPATAEVLAESKIATLERPVVLKELPLAVRAANDTDAGGEVREIDLGVLAASDDAIYRVRIPGVGVSWPTRVSLRALDEAFVTMARGLYFNRWGRVLDKPWTDLGPRPADHPFVFTSDNTNFRGENSAFKRDDPQEGRRPLSGGHHDAADFDQRLFHFQIPMMLMRAYETNPGAFRDGQLNIPESGNGIPDLLDEALYNLRGWMQLQEADGGVRAGVESYRDCTPWLYADVQDQPFWTFAREPYHTMRMAALFAQAARLVAPFDRARADELKDCAQRAYDFAIAHGVDDASKGPILFGSGELYRTTGEKRYRETFERVWKANQNGPHAPGVYAYLYQPDWFLAPVQQILGDFVVDYWQAPDVDSAGLALAKEKMEALADTAVAAMDGYHAHRNGREPTLSPSWGLGTTVGRYVRVIAMYLKLAEPPKAESQRYIDAISLSADYLLGANPGGMIYTTGLGARHTEDPLHSDSGASIREGRGPVPGISVFGPAANLPKKPYYEYGANVLYPEYAQHPLMRRYADIPTFVHVNEFSTFETLAPNAELMAELHALSVD